MSETPETPDPAENEIQPVESSLENTSESQNNDAHEDINQQASSAEGESTPESSRAEDSQEESVESESTATESEQMSEEQVDELENVEFPEASLEIEAIDQLAGVRMRDVEDGSKGNDHEA